MPPGFPAISSFNILGPLIYEARITHASSIASVMKDITCNDHPAREDEKSPLQKYANTVCPTAEFATFSGVVFCTIYMRLIVLVGSATISASINASKLIRYKLFLI